MVVKVPESRDEFEIAIFCALPREANYILSLFEKNWRDEGRDYGKARGDTNHYTCGVMSDHNVVLVHMGRVGKANASSVAAHLSLSFLRIKHALNVGVCGAVPVHLETGKEIISGDIIISDEIVAYDSLRRYPDKDEKRAVPEDCQPSREIRSFLAALKTEYYSHRIKENMKNAFKTLQEKNSHLSHPGGHMDWLYRPSFLHQHRQAGSLHVCSECDETNGNTCAQARREDCSILMCHNHVTQLVRRKRLDGTSLEAGNTPADSTHIIHFGKVGSGDIVMKSGTHRDELAQKHNLVAFEMEGSGMCCSVPTTVIKAVCDYADSHKSKLWQNYAAANAAACTKAILQEMPLIGPSSLQGFAERSRPSSSMPVHFRVPGTMAYETVVRHDEPQGFGLKMVATYKISQISTAFKGRLQLPAAIQTYLQCLSFPVLRSRATSYPSLAYLWANMLSPPKNIGQLRDLEALFSDVRKRRAFVFGSLLVCLTWILLLILLEISVLRSRQQYFHQKANGILGLQGSPLSSLEGIWHYCTTSSMGSATTAHVCVLESWKTDQ